MEIKIQKIYPTELQKFSESEEFLHFENLPLSRKRILSYLNNPRKDDNSPVLYLAFYGNKLISFRSVLQDKIKNNDGESLNVIWISGSWTHPDFRKKGVSRMIFDEVSQDYDQNIFITNYGALSYSLYSKRQDLCNFRFLNGHRFYYRLPLADLLPPKSNFFSSIQFLLKWVDKMGNCILDLRSEFHKSYLNSNIEKVEFNDELNDFISNHHQNSLFTRNTEEFKWILDFPWVEERLHDEQTDEKYHFTTSARRFSQNTLVYKEGGNIKAFLFYSVKNKVLKVHYLFVDSDVELNAFSAYLLDLIQKEKISYTMLTDQRLIQNFQKKGGFIFSKVWRKGFFAGKKLLENYPEISEKEIYMGDGDTLFT